MPESGIVVPALVDVPDSVVQRVVQWMIANHETVSFRPSVSLESISDHPSHTDGTMKEVSLSVCCNADIANTLTLKADRDRNFNTEKPYLSAEILDIRVGEGVSKVDKKKRKFFESSLAAHAPRSIEHDALYQLIFENGRRCRQLLVKDVPLVMEALSEAKIENEGTDMPC